MKRIIFLLTAMIVLSCSNQKQESWSCNPVIDAKVKAQFAILLETPRTEIGRESREFQRAFYRGLTPEQRYQIWEKKFEKILSYNWDRREKKHLMRFIGEVDLSLFKRSEAELESFSNFSAEWIKESEEQFGWKKDNLYFLIVSPFQDKKEWKTFLTASRTLDSQICNCNYIWYSLDCWGSGKCEEESSCPGKYDDPTCGPVGLFSCNGTCVEKGLSDPGGQE